MANKVLVIGSGAREHAIAWKLSESIHVAEVFVAPGNAGTQEGEPKVTNVSLNVSDHSSIVSWCHSNGVSLVFVGPEDPLAEGIADSLNKAGVYCFGPSAAAARIEASKEFSKDLMTKHNIPTARWASFTDSVQACRFIESAEFPALVVKASGLAAGKGVIVAADKEEAIRAVKDILEDRAFGEAGSTVVIEELLEGEEVSCLAFSDGVSVVCMPPAQDHKRLSEGDQGPNTGGMGAYCPCDLITEEELEIVKKNVLQKTVDALREAGTPFVGVLYAGMMLTKDGPKVLEFNCRFGDPETQVLIPLLKTDLYEVIEHCVHGTLSSINVEFEHNSVALGVVLASSGYPGSYPKGLPITGVKSAESTKLGVKTFYAGASYKDGSVVTSGGRVLTVVAKAATFHLASRRAQAAAQDIQFDGKQYRKDIGHKALKKILVSHVVMTYKKSGVNINAGDKLVESIKHLAASTARPGCCPDLGQFGGVFDLSVIGFKDVLLVSGTDGVGTKLMVAHETNIHSTVGIDLVAMCVNDILCQGALPLWFLDYYGCGCLEKEVAQSVIKGISDGCIQAGCALIGGETAELPGIYKIGDYDLSGVATGFVRSQDVLPRFSDIKEGDIVLGLPSSGPHSNGYSLIRKLVDLCGLSYDIECPFDVTKTFGEYLLTATKIYVRNLLPAIKERKIKGLAHITGGGLPGNVPRALPESLRVELDASQWSVHPIFGWIAEKGNVESAEMLRTFNCGIGMVAIVDKEDVAEVQDLISMTGEQALIIGQVLACIPGDEQVTVNNFEEALKKTYGGYCLKSDSSVINCSVQVKRGLQKKRVAVLISGSGTNLQALIDFTRKPSNESEAEIVLVISNVESAYGLKRAADAGIAAKFINHKVYKSRQEFDDAVHQVLMKENVDIVCLAGFMRRLTGQFVNKWKGKVLNIHPSLLPAFKGLDTHKMVLESKVEFSGCTVHFVVEEVDGGAIIEQERVPVYPNDTEETLSERVKTVEHKAYPKALELVASGRVTYNEDGTINRL